MNTANSVKHTRATEAVSEVGVLSGMTHWVMNRLHRMPLLNRIKTRFNIQRYRDQAHRKLEIGPGAYPLSGFESLNVVGGLYVDYVWNAAQPLPFDDGLFELIYASHVLEHIPWYQTVKTLREWGRILKPGGVLEVWVPDGLKICQAFVNAETAGGLTFLEDGWSRFNEDHDPCTWASGRIFTYGDGKGTVNHPNWHRALFSERRLRQLFEQAGFENIRRMSPDEVRGVSHGWINMGICGQKA